MAYAKRLPAGAVVRALQPVQVARGEDGAWHAAETFAFEPPQGCCYTPPPSPGQEAHAAARRSLGFLAETVSLGQARQEAATGDWLVPVAYDRWLDDKSAQKAQRTLRVRHDPKLGFRVVG
jgi:hypothetical protein